MSGRRFSPMWDWAKPWGLRLNAISEEDNTWLGKHSFLPQKDDFLWEEWIFPQSGIVRFQNGPRRPMPRLFVGGTNLSPIRYCSLSEWAKEADATNMNFLNPISRRDTSHSQLISMSSQVGYTHQVDHTKRRFFVGGTNLWWIHLTCELMLISCGWEASLSDVGFSKFVWVASVSSAYSQSEQYLIGERFVPPTIHTHTHTHTNIYIYIYAHYSKMTTEVRLFKYFKSYFFY